MRIHIGSDHAGFALKVAVIEHLRKAGNTVVDHGPKEFTPGDDYPAQSVAVASAAVADPEALGLVIGGTGNGEQIAANKVAGARAALIWSVESAELARVTTNANVAGLGARMHDRAEAMEIIGAFLAAQFQGDERHERRIAQLTKYEKYGRLD
ncbi:MAG: ribose-5-phosphate isomerase [Candidatus Nanopelagicales bacterium]